MTCNQEEQSSSILIRTKFNRSKSLSKCLILKTSLQRPWMEAGIGRICLTVVHLGKQRQESQGFQVIIDSAVHSTLS